MKQQINDLHKKKAVKKIEYIRKLYKKFRECARILKKVMNILGLSSLLRLFDFLYGFGDS